MPNPFRGLPSVSQLLESPQLKSIVQTANHNVVVDGVRSFLDQLRQQLASTAEEVAIPTPQELASRIARWLRSQDEPPLRSVINATGVLLHTGLGRAPLAARALEQVVELSQGYASVELDLNTGQRGQRTKSVSRLLCELTGAEAATVVNNNAAATVLVLSALAHGREVIVSRGQLIEIGGSFRLPDVMSCSGATLREVGTTNKTRLADYQNAIGENTAAILSVHPSNYRIVGFSASVPIVDLAALGKRRGIPVIDDIGSGALIDYGRYGLVEEPIAAESIKAGADVVLFSGDKLLGGPQCGVIVGSRRHIEQIMTHPLMRAMRVGKLTLAALGATLRLYRKIEEAERDIPLLSMLATPLENLKLRAERITAQIGDSKYIDRATVVQCRCTLGGGSIPAQELPSWAIAMETKDRTVDQVAADLRRGWPSVIGRIQNDRLLLDLRTVRPSEDLALVEALAQLGRREEREGSAEPKQAMEVET